MQYLLLIYANENAMLNAPKEAAGQMISAYQAYTEAMTKAGVRVGSNRLRPTSDATTVRAPNGKASMGGNLNDGAGKTRVRTTATLWVGGGPGAASALAGSQPT